MEVLKLSFSAQLMGCQNPPAFRGLQHPALGKPPQSCLGSHRGQCFRFPQSKNEEFYKQNYGKIYDKNRKLSIYRSFTFSFRESHFQKKSFLQFFQPLMSGLSGFMILWISETVEHLGLFQPQVIFLFAPFESISDVRCVMKIVWLVTK